MNRAELIAINFPFAVKYERTNEWYGIHWPALSQWCTTTYGYGNWEYYSPNFRFRTEEAKLMFALRWA